MKDSDSWPPRQPDVNGGLAEEHPQFRNALHLPFTELMNDLCEIVSDFTQASTVIIAQRDPNLKTIKVRGRTGTLLSEVDMSFVMPDLDTRRMPVIVVPDVRADARFQNHPLLRLMPHIRSLIVMLVPGCEPSTRAVLKIMNPRKSVLGDGTAMRTLTDITRIAAHILQLELNYGEPPPRKMESWGQLSPSSIETPSFSESGGIQHDREGDNTCAEFLRDTLIKKRSLHSRNGADFVTLRAWRKPIRKYQISALTAVKRSPSSSLVKEAASEMAAAITQTHGANAIKSVVPVPPGSSGKVQSFSTLLAEEIARQLGATYCNVLAPLGPAARGKSSPRKSATFDGYSVLQQPTGPMVVVDDVVSSGRHLELASKALRVAGQPVYAFCWIGN